jgi:hypothetical protein
MRVRRGKIASSLTTEYPANGSSFLNTRSVKKRGHLRGFVSGFRAGGIRADDTKTLVVKLLRAYGECLGARSR